MYRTVNPGKPGLTDSWDGQEAAYLIDCHLSVPREAALSGSILTPAHSSILEAEASSLDRQLLHQLQRQGSLSSDPGGPQGIL